MNNTYLIAKGKQKDKVIEMIRIRVLYAHNPDLPGLLA